MRTIRKRFTITQEMITWFAPGDASNNPVALALKIEAFPEAQEIIVRPDEIWVDGRLIQPTRELTRFIQDWDRGKRVVPMILGYFDTNS